MIYVTVSRDPFARQEIVRMTKHTKQDCQRNNTMNIGKITTNNTDHMIEVVIGLTKAGVGFTVIRDKGNSEWIIETTGAY
jgi:hypothetical protein